MDYYLEEKYHPFARGIFGRTPQMMEHYSNILGVKYPWEKYAQVVVRDFVSGAMENTTAVIHGEFVQMDEREMLDRHEEDIIAHELIHHWFGDLVTCESWANLPLNEAFATYGEYIWREEGFGRMAADKHLDTDLNNYLRESRRKQEDMIRFDYSNKEDMFDSHSYAKGGRVLHMLRYYLGDEAFYEGLQKYLKDNAFSTVEIHQLRLAMEEVSGEDLNWFFNQWFLASGHPILAFSYDYNTEEKELTVISEQLQDLLTTPLYKLHVAIDITVEGKVERHPVIIQNGKESFRFNLNNEPQNVNVDAEKVLLAEIIDEKSEAWWLEQLNAPRYIDQKQLLKNLSGSALETAITHNLNHSFWGVRELAVQAIENTDNPLKFESALLEIAEKDERTLVRAAAIELLSELENATEHEELFTEATQAMSYAISGAGLEALASIKPERGLMLAQKLELQSKNELEEAVMRIYAFHGGQEQFSYFDKKLKKASNYDLYLTAAFFTEYLMKQELEIAIKGVPMIVSAIDNGPSWAGYYFNLMVEKIVGHHLKLSDNKKQTKMLFEQATN